MQEQSVRRSNTERTEATRTALVAAARSLFVDKGYAETGTPEIVAKAGVTRGALYHHFADKADLFRAVVTREAAAVAAQIETESADPTSALDALTSGADAYFAAMAAPGRVRLLLLDGPAVLGHREMAHIDRKAGGEELREGLAFALPANDLPTATMDALADILSAAFDRATLATSEGAPAADYRHAVRRVLDGLIRAGEQA
ncbi:MAG: TetR/AcrR family transcriptional regulator [Pseudomonadota bacterium]